MLRDVPWRTRTVGVVAGSAVAALAVGSLTLVPAAPAPTIDVASSTDASAARSSAALSRSLSAQSRLLGSTAPATTMAAAAKTQASTRASAKVGSIVYRGLPVLLPGARHSAVKTLQRKLGVKATGWYGPMTLAAVVAFQKARKLPAQGYVGLRTWQALYAPKAKASTRSTSASRSTVRAEVTNGRVCPAPGSRFGSGFGVPRSGHLHQGVDMVGRRGLPILAIESGSILRAGYQSNGAIRIVQQGRSGSKFYYGHMDSISVRAGSTVSRGQVIGYMGDTGSPGQVHLHFEYWRSGGESAAVDPYPLLKSLCWS